MDVAPLGIGSALPHARLLRAGDAALALDDTRVADHGARVADHSDVWRGHRGVLLRWAVRRCGSLAVRRLVEEVFVEGQALDELALKMQTQGGGSTGCSWRSCGALALRRV